MNKMRVNPDLDELEFLKKILVNQNEVSSQKVILVAIGDRNNS